MLCLDFSDPKSFIFLQKTKPQLKTILCTDFIQQTVHIYLYRAKEWKWAEA